MIERERKGAVELLRLDSGRANALDLDTVRAFADALRETEARAESQVLLITGRPGIFCAGLDAETVRGGNAAGDALLDEMDALLRALLASRLRVVSCVTGHAVAAGAMLLLASDVRIGAKGKFRIGFSEVGVGLPLPEFPVRLARQRLNRRWFESATLLGRLFSPEEAVDAGFLDWVEVAGGALRVAMDTAEGLAKLPEAAYVGTLAGVRGDLLEP
jgi:enoyl-CoA hydratase